jgi:hypothetical protein
LQGFEKQRSCLIRVRRKTRQAGRRLVA